MISLSGTSVLPQEVFKHITDNQIETGILEYLKQHFCLHIPSIGMNLLIYWFKFAYRHDLKTNQYLLDWFQSNRVDPVVQSLLNKNKQLSREGNFLFDEY